MNHRLACAVIAGLVLMFAGRTVVDAQERKPDLVLKGAITEKDRETYVEVPFTVPAGVVRVSVDFHYTGHEHQTTIDLG